MTTGSGRPAATASLAEAVEDPEDAEDLADGDSGETGAPREAVGSRVVGWPDDRAGAGICALSGATVPEQPAATAVSKQTVSRALRRLPHITSRVQYLGG